MQPPFADDAILGKQEMLRKLLKQKGKGKLERHCRQQSAVSSDRDEQKGNVIDVFCATWQWELFLLYPPPLPQRSVRGGGILESACLYKNLNILENLRNGPRLYELNVQKKRNSPKINPISIVKLSILRHVLVSHSPGNFRNLLEQICMESIPSKCNLL
jgi:hypothetical protein